MCPDVDAYAPAITAAFGLGSVIEGGHPGHRLRVQIADRAPRTTNPVLAVAADLVGIAAGRATLSDVLALAASPPVRYRFALTDDDLATVETWARQAGIRWGLSGPLRRAYQLDRFDQNTWETGLDRLMTGVAMAEHELLVGDVLPLDDVSSADIDLAGRLAELLARVRACVEQLQDAGPVRERLTVLRDAVLSLSDTAPSDAWQLAQFERTMARVVAGVEAHAGPETEVRLTDLRGMLDVESGARPTRANFRTGNLTVCTMVPMRSVPHRVVCLLGLEDGTFPRTQAVDGDDVLARDPVTGELDLRSQDRQLLLDAVMAATEKLVLVYTAAHPGTGQERPPSVPLGELMDALDATAAGPVREQILVRHPLQPNDARNVTAGELVPDEPFSLASAALPGHRAGRRPHLGRDEMRRVAELGDVPASVRAAVAAQASPGAVLHGSGREAVGREQHDGVVAEVFGDAVQRLAHPIGEEVDDRRVVVPLPDERERRAGTFGHHLLHALDVRLDRHAGPVGGHDHAHRTLDALPGHLGDRVGDERRGVFHSHVRPDLGPEQRGRAGRPGPRPAARSPRGSGSGCRSRRSGGEGPPGARARALVPPGCRCSSARCRRALWASRTP